MTVARLDAIGLFRSSIPAILSGKTRLCAYVWIFTGDDVKMWVRILFAASNNRQCFICLLTAIITSKLHCWRRQTEHRQRILPGIYLRTFWRVCPGILGSYQWSPSRPFKINWCRTQRKNLVCHKKNIMLYRNPKEAALARKKLPFIRKKPWCICTPPPEGQQRGGRGVQIHTCKYNNNWEDMEPNVSPPPPPSCAGNEAPTGLRWGMKLCCSLSSIRREKHN